MEPWEQYAQASNTQPSQEPWEKFAALKQPESDNYLSRTGSDVMASLNKGADILKKQDLNPLSSAIQISSNALNAELAPAGEAIRSGYNALPQSVTQPINNTIGQAAQGVQSLYNTGINKLANADVGKSIGDYLMNSPHAQNALQEVSDDAKAVGNLITMAPIQKGVEIAKNAALDAGTGIEGLADAHAVKYPDLPIASNEPITRDMVKQASQNAYKAVEDSGTTLAPQLTDKVLNVLDDAQQKPIAGKVLTSENADINKALSEYRDLKGSPLTMRDYQQIDSTLGDKAAQAYVSGNTNKGRIISDAQDKIRSLIQPDNLQPGDITGGAQGLEALTQHAIPLWSTQAKMGDIEKIITRANAMDNPSTSMKTGFRNLMLNEGKMRQYPPEVQKMIAKAANSGKADDLLGILGSRLNAIAGAAIGGIPGSIISNASSMAARGLRTGLKNNQANAVLNGLVEQVRPSIEKYTKPTIEATSQQAIQGAPMPTLKEIMAMPPAQAKAYMSQIKP